MNEYIVDWTENVFADTPEQAAKKAIDMLIDKEMTMSFVVTVLRTMRWLSSRQI